MLSMTRLYIGGGVVLGPDVGGTQGTGERRERCGKGHEQMPTKAWRSCQGHRPTKVSN